MCIYVYICIYIYIYIISLVPSFFFLLLASAQEDDKNKSESLWPHQFTKNNLNTLFDIMRRILDLILFNCCLAFPQPTLGCYRGATSVTRY